MHFLLAAIWRFQRVCIHTRSHTIMLINIHKTHIAYTHIIISISASVSPLILQRPELSSTVLLQGVTKVSFYEQWLISLLLWTNWSMSDWLKLFIAFWSCFFPPRVWYKGIGLMVMVYWGWLALFTWTSSKVNTNWIHVLVQSKV